METSGVIEAVSAELNVPSVTWSGTTVTIVGMGKSGQSAADLLLDRGAAVTLMDERFDTDLETLKVRYEQRGARVLLGGGSDHLAEYTDLVVVSPGIPKDHSFIRLVESRGIPVIGELELGGLFLQTPILAVTGTNGKSTTVRLIGAFLQESGKHVFIGGNIGLPLCEAVPKQGNPLAKVPYEYAVVEVSSFQLETINQFKPWISVILNITPDHLDRHHTQEDYQAAKRRIFENQTDRDWTVLNADDPIVQEMGRETRANVWEFSLKRRVAQGMYLVEDVLYLCRDGMTKALVHRGDIHLRGDHNLANAMAAMCVGILCGCETEEMIHVLRSGPLFEHTLEFVRAWNGVTFINDSKGTNVDATQKALQSFEQPVVLILGGKDKGGDFSLLMNEIKKKVKGVVVMGEAAHSIQQALQDQVLLQKAKSLTDALKLAVGIAERGDVVLFSPACASFDMFQSYHHRGVEFKRIVGELS